jgi:tetratricopeptide (TPR) repeat protein
LIVDYGLVLPLTLGQVLPYAAMLVVLLAATIVALFRRPMLGFLGAWFFITLAPTSSFVPISNEVAAERRMYLPLAAVIALIVVAVHAIARAASARCSAAPHLPLRAAVALGFVVAGTLGFLTHQRNSIYADEIAIMRQTVADRPGNPRAYVNLAAALFTSGRTDEGIAQYRRASEMCSGSVALQCKLATAMWKGGRLEEAVALYKHVLTLAPGYMEVHAKLGRTLSDLGRFEEAVPHYLEVLRTTTGLGDVVETLRSLAEALAHTGRADQAIDNLRQALQIAPNDPLTHHALAVVLAQRGDFDEAAAHWSEALRLNPTYTEARRGLAGMLARQGKFYEAIREYQEVLRVNPADAKARAGLNETMTRMNNATRR